MRGLTPRVQEKPKTILRGTSFAGGQGVPEHARQEAASSWHYASRGWLGGLERGFRGGGTPPDNPLSPARRAPNYAE